ncbi:MAG TPA: hypothetical protein VK172_14695 [Lentimicrobium sp.]|nr:hypothetical protein [Bacteroidales bacterium]HLO92410.1 hypothetical protein [Lentimicrobium sp.]
MDFVLDNDYIPETENGDFVCKDELQQQQRLLLASVKGEWKENPLAGCGIINYVNEENPQAMIMEIKRQFKADGLNVLMITYNDSELRIDAERS